MDPDLDPLVPRPLDRPTAVPLEPDADLTVLDKGKILAAPDDPADLPAWREALVRWRDGARAGVGRPEPFDDAIYARDDLRWARTCVTVAQVWLWDELLYDHERRVFTPERLLADAERFGGFDGVVLWHAYPIIGIDDRNQWDYYRLVPGLRALVDRFHELGVRVFVDYNPWDTGTRPAGPGAQRDDAGQLAAVVRDLDADGVFLDTLKEGDPTMLRALEAARPGVACEGESTLPLARLADHPLSWAQWFADSAAPGVIRARWFEPRHQLHHVRRWNRDHAAELRSAWLNGVGVMCWEVVFGVWVGWNARDAATLAVMSRAQRRLAHLTTEGEWTPLVDLGPVPDGVYGTTYELGDEKLLCLVNTGGHDAIVRLASPARDIRGGRGLERVVAVPAYGIGGAYWPAAGDDAGWLDDDIAQVADGSFPYRRQRRLTSRAGGAKVAGRPVDAGFAGVDLTPGRYDLTVRYRCRETGIYGVAPFVDEWKPLPPRLHDQRTVERAVTVGSVSVGAHEVTRAEFAAFVATTGHQVGLCVEQPWWEPYVGTGWPLSLLPDDWRSMVRVADPDGPATQVGLADARAFASWLGARLPTEDEWQLAARSPRFNRARDCVWEWTDSEHSDGRTRFCLLKGGSSYRAESSSWYFDGGVRGPDFAATYLLPGFGLDRSTSIGFRIAWDVPGPGATA